jgi:hypothetical protein
MPEIKFEQELEVFRTEIATAIQFFHAHLAVHNVAAGSKPVFNLLNEAALFWNTSLGALQTAAFIALGRIFDQSSQHNLDKLLGLARNNLYIFSKEALRRRKHKQAPNLTPSELDDYLQRAYEPKPKDFRSLQKDVKKWRDIYESTYRDIRRKFFAHKEVSGPEEIYALFENTRIDQLQSMLNFLSSLHNMLLLLFFDGRKPDLIWTIGSSDLQERITREVEQFLLKAAGVTKPKLKVKEKLAVRLEKT